MNTTIYLRTWGDLACFTRPEMKVERVSYPIITPGAARGILEAILYKPQFRWKIRRIAVRRPIRFISFRRNEVKSKLSSRGETRPIIVEDDRTQRNTLALRDVEYVIEASMELTTYANQERRRPRCHDEDESPDSLVKYLCMFNRRAEKGQCFVQPCFGCREFPASFEPADESALTVADGINPDSDLGLMLYDVFDLNVSGDYTPGKVEARPRISLFEARLKDGVVDVGNSRIISMEQGVKL